jgi:hypothetical protein
MDQSEYKSLSSESTKTGFPRKPLGVTANSPLSNLRDQSLKTVGEDSAAMSSVGGLSGIPMMLLMRLDLLKECWGEARGLGGLVSMVPFNLRREGGFEFASAHIAFGFNFTLTGASYR